MGRLPIDEENNVLTFLTDYKQDKLIIDIDVNRGINILDKDGGVMRELEFNQELSREEAVGIIIHKLKKIL